VKIIKVKIGSSIRTIGAKKEHIFIVTNAGRIYCYNYKNDEMLWNLSINDAITGEMIIENNLIYLFGRKGRIYCISIAGALKWDRDIFTCQPVRRYTSLINLPAMSPGHCWCPG